ncbi:hypothetical protein [uncultured Chryseobacterium sp.]|jgi:hypothetical protein|uniref:hypothetical protein n=1 Tax=uncultured Chryseobacterium sp. TaxID=259322 RepID=UPI0026274557|nr:hypothetical protein [uncultured Chryseobacterium sp.]
MSVQIEIKELYIRDLIEFYLEKQKVLRNEVNALQTQLKDISAVIMQLRQAQLSNSVSMLKGNEVYNSKWPWVKKITFAIQEAGKPLTTKEIVDILTGYEPDFINDRKRVVASVSSTLSVKTGGEFEKSESETGENAYSIITNKNTINESFGTNITINDDELPF